MKILGIDYGKSKIGLALSVAGISEPLKVVRVSSFDEAVKKVKAEIDLEKPDRVVVGVSEGEMGRESKKFATTLLTVIDIEVDLQDETLSTYDAQALSRESGAGRKKRNELEDAYAASVVLQNYLDRK